MINFKGSQFKREIIMWGVREYVAYPILYRQLEEIMDERGVAGIIPCSIARLSGIPRRLRNSSVVDYVLWTGAGGWTRSM